MSSAPPPYGPLPPEQPPEEPQGYQPFDSYYRPQTPPPGQQRQGGARRNGVVGGLVATLAAIWAYGKYALLFLSKFAALKTLLTLVISFGAYAFVFGPWFAAALVAMLLIHELGHVFEMRRQGGRASALILIPFVGAATFNSTHPRNALQAAQIAIAGPLAGTVGATVAFVLYGETRFQPLLLAAYLGFFINLINLIPITILDGGWIMAVVSKWFQVIGLGMMLLAVLVLGLSPIFLIFALLGIPGLIARFRNDRADFYQAVPVPARLAMGAAWFLLVGFLAFATLQTGQLMAGVVG
jgi:hypothetical protein